MQSSRQFLDIVAQRKALVKKAKFLLIGLLAVFGLAFGSVFVFDSLVSEPTYVDPSGQGRSQEQVEAALLKHVQEANAKAAKAIAQRASEFSEFINSRKAGSKQFAQDIVSWHGKWRAVKPYLPFTSKDGHKEFVAEKFDKHIFTTKELGDAAKGAIERSVKDLESIENELAVSLSKEILGRSLVPEEIPVAKASFQEAIEQVVSASKQDAAKAAGILVVSEVSSQVGTQVLVRIGISTGILATGAANSWWSLGAGIVIGLAVDLIWDWIDNPADDIERETLAALDIVSAKVSSAIVQEMNHVASQRFILWNSAAQGMVK